MLTRQQAALTRAINSGDPKRVIAVVQAAVADFDRYMWPDRWFDWQRALNDAESKLGLPLSSL